MITHGFDLTSDLVCEGIIGDGCGGGRIFFVKDEKLFVNDPMTNENTILLENVYKANLLYKKSCIVYINCKDKQIKFDLSSMAIVV